LMNAGRYTSNIFRFLIIMKRDSSVYPYSEKNLR
jgi:hypothetical protein